MLLSNVNKIEDLDKALAEIDKAMTTLRGPKPDTAIKRIKRQTAKK